MISEELLLKYQAKRVEYEKNSVIFNQGERADFFYQIDKGTVHMSTLSEDGKVFIQGIFSDGESFGEPPLFIHAKYPSSAITDEDTFVYELYKDNLFELLNDHSQNYMKIIQNLSEMLYFKAIMGKEISLHNPEHRILTLFNYYKTEEKPQKINLTRQQIANLTALRVETVIRTIKKLEEKGELNIDNRKIYY